MSRVLTDATLERLLAARCHLDTYTRWTWFRDCRLEKTILFVPSPALADSIQRLFLPALLAALPGCQVVVERNNEKAAKKVFSGKPDAIPRRLLDED